MLPPEQLTLYGEPGWHWSERSQDPSAERLYNGIYNRTDDSAVKFTHPENAEAEHARAERFEALADERLMQIETHTKRVRELDEVIKTVGGTHVQEEILRQAEVQVERYEEAMARTTELFTRVFERIDVHEERAAERHGATLVAFNAVALAFQSFSDSWGHS